MKIETKELTPELWPKVEELFGRNGACGGCWCQAWKLEKGEDWKRLKGDKAKKRLRSGIEAGTTLGILAFVEERPVGWCNFGPRASYPRLNRCRTLECNDIDEVWSIPCFFVARGYREKGVATALLRHALRALKRRKARVAEAYPSKPDKNGRYVPSFAWTGTHSLFREAGFAVVGNPLGARQRVRKEL